MGLVGNPPAVFSAAGAWGALPAAAGAAEVDVAGDPAGAAEVDAAFEDGAVVGVAVGDGVQASTSVTIQVVATTGHRRAMARAVLTMSDGA
jgi:hypothetical protein